MKLCIGPEWEQTRKFLQDLVSRASFNYDNRGLHREFLTHLQNVAWSVGFHNVDTLTEPRTEKRLGLIFGTNIGLRRSYRRFMSEIGDIAICVTPAWELVEMGRGSSVNNWHQRWLCSGGKTYAGRMIALKCDPIWRNISVFPFPFPPFDISDNMNVVGVPRGEVVSLGILKSDAKINMLAVEEPRSLYFFDTLPDGNFRTEVPVVKEEDCEDSDENPSEQPPVETKFTKVAEVGSALKAQKVLPPEEESRLLQMLAEAVTEGFDNYPDWLALAYRYTGEIYDRSTKLEQAVEYYGYALQFDQKVGVRKRYNALLKQISSSKRE